MDYEVCSSYSFEVVACDLGESQSLSSTTVVTIAVSDVNDNPPRFERELYRGAVKESDPLGEVVAVLKTKDRDGTDQNRLVSFYITGEERKRRLTIDLNRNRVPAGCVRLKIIRWFNRPAVIKGQRMN